MTAGRWVTGDHFGLPMPADLDGLRAGGTGFLTEAFRAFGGSGRVTGITELEEVPGGSTGRKARLRIAYEQPGAAAELFVKFSRDFDDPIRDRGKTQMQSEVLFASLTRDPGFPITVPAALFADYHHDTGTGLLVSERIPFGCNGIERHYAKCLDYSMPEPLDHYRALLSALGQLVGAHRSGRIAVGDRFPVDIQAAQVGERTAIDPEKLNRRMDQLTDFAAACPGLLPANTRTSQFLSRLRLDALQFLRCETAVWEHLAAVPDHIALCHWNANVDNAWFWRDADGVLRCGLMDWGCVGQMNVAMALWGAMSAAENEIWDHHLDELLNVFVSEIRRCGGPDLDVDALGRQIMLYVGIMTVGWLLDVPALIRNRFGDRAATMTRTDPEISDNESVRAPLQMLTNALNLWETKRFGELLPRRADGP